MLRFVGDCNALTDSCGYLHVGDVAHFLSNTLRGRDPAPYVRLYHGATGELAAVLLLHPYRAPSSSYELMIHPVSRSSELEAALITEAERLLTANSGSSDGSFTIDVADCDTPRQAALLAAGYTAAGEPHMVITTRSLSTPIPASDLPPGYTIRAAAGLHEADKLAAVHRGAFNSTWDAETYARVMQTPGFRIDHELVVVAPDGTFAAFLIYWTDAVTKSGLFEPVGCHRDHQRRGLTKALMFEAMRRMIDEGMTEAAVLHLAQNPPAQALYSSAGFTPKYTLTSYHSQPQNG